jgi:FixJ family two-component response regulator
VTRAVATAFVLDDDASFVRSTVRLLASWGYAAEGFTSAAAFLARETLPAPACLIVDQRMPGTSGLEVQRALSRSPRRLPVVFVSGHADVQTGVEAMKRGAVDYLPKPVDEQVLLEAIRRALAQDVRVQAERRRAERARAALAALPPEERRVCQLVVEGLRDDRIAATLGWTEEAVRSSRVRAMAALEVESLIELARALELAEGG